MRRQLPDERRSGRPDRRVAVAAPPLPGGLERRIGPRRRLPRPLWRQWPSLLISAALGVVVAVSVQPAPATPAPPPLPTPPATIAIQLPFTRAEAAALRDEADRLTPAAVALDERAQARWWPLRPDLEAAAADDRLPADLRDELVATLAALDRNGL